MASLIEQYCSSERLFLSATRISMCCVVHVIFKAVQYIRKPRACTPANILMNACTNHRGDCPGSFKPLLYCAFFAMMSALYARITDLQSTNLKLHHTPYPLRIQHYFSQSFTIKNCNYRASLMEHLFPTFFPLFSHASFPNILQFHFLP